MERRDVIRYTALFMGASLSASTISAIIAGCKVDTSEGWEPTHFSTTESDFIREFAETILPRTSTPGAIDAMVERFLDTVRPLRYSPEENEKFNTDLRALMHQAKAEIGKEFVKATPDQRLEWVRELDKNSFETLKGQPARLQEERPFYITMKEQILAGYFSSEIVAKEYFAFDPVPGRYDACIPYSDIGKAWAL